MKGLVIGNGFLGQEYARAGHDVFDRSKTNFKNIEHVNTEKIIHNIEQLNYTPDFIVNCIGKSNTRWCEDLKNWKDLLYTNSIIPMVISNIAKELNIPFVHISTGCVYTGINKKETDFIESHCHYVVSKIAGENGCSENDLILRPRLYFSQEIAKGNLLCKLPNFTNYIDEINSYTRTKTIVEATESLIEAKQKGIFNVAEEGTTTIWDIADRLSLLKKDSKKIKEALLHKTENLFLVNNTMDISKLKKFYQPPSLFDSIDECWKVLQKRKHS